MNNKENKEEEKKKLTSDPELVPAESKNGPAEASQAESKSDDNLSENGPDSIVEPQEQAPSKFQLFMNKLLRAVVIALLLFAAGLVTGYFVLQRPAVGDLSGEVQTLESQINDLNAEISDLEGEVSTLESQIKSLEPFEERNIALEAALADEELHVQVLSALRDVQSAQIALSEGELDAARLSLTRTGGKLEAIREMLPENNQGVVDSMLQRLDLSLTGLDSDLVAAASDLSVLENSLTEIESLLFAVP